VPIRNVSIKFGDASGTSETDAKLTGNAATFADASTLVSIVTSVSAGNATAFAATSGISFASRAVAGNALALADVSGISFASGLVAGAAEVLAATSAASFSATVTTGIALALADVSGISFASGVVAGDALTLAAVSGFAADVTAAELDMETLAAAAAIAFDAMQSASGALTLADVAALSSSSAVVGGDVLTLADVSAISLEAGITSGKALVLGAATALVLDAAELAGTALPLADAAAIAVDSRLERPAPLELADVAAVAFVAVGPWRVPIMFGANATARFDCTQERKKMGLVGFFYGTAGDGQIIVLEVIPGSMAPLPAGIDDGSVLTLVSGAPAWAPAQNSLADGTRLLDFAPGYFLVLTPGMVFGRVDISGVLTRLNSIPPHDTFVRRFSPFAGPAVVRGRYRGFDAFEYASSPETMMQGNATPLPLAGDVTVIAVCATTAIEGVAFEVESTNPLCFEAGSGLVCFDDSQGNQVTYPAEDLRGLSVLTWQATLGTGNPFVFRINGRAVATVGTAPHAATGQAGYTIGNKPPPGGGRAWNGPIELVAVWPRLLTASELEQNESLVTRQFGTVRNPDFLSDNGSIFVARAQGNFGASYASTRIETGATVLNAIYCGVGGSSSQVWVLVDGELYQAFDVPGGGVLTQFEVMLDGRVHEVEFWDSGQTDTGPATQCATLVELRGGGFNMLPKALADTRISVYGNSYTQGVFAGFVPLGGVAGIAGWWQLMRLDGTFPGRVSNIGSGGRSLFTDHTMDPTMVLLAQWLTSQAAEVVPGNRRTIWYAGIELNDWDQSQWSAASFGASLALLVAAIFAIDPTVLVVLQSSLPAIGEGVANTFGDNLAAYRTQVANVAAANPDHTALVDGTLPNNGVAAMTLADLTGPAPGHPSPDGMIHYFNWAKATPALEYSFQVLLDGALAWFRADQGVTLTAGNVSKLASFGRSGNAARNALGALGTRPAAPAPSPPLLSQEAITFANATAQVLTTGTWSTALPFPCTIYLVGFALSAVGLKWFFDSLAADLPANRFTLYSNAGVPTLRVGITDIVGAGSVVTTTPHVYCCVLNVTAAMYIDDMTTPNATGGPFPATHPTGLNIGDDVSGGPDAGTTIAELLVYNSAHTAAQRATVGAYLKARYGL
jgi:hypothetical protein